MRQLSPFPQSPVKNIRLKYCSAVANHGLGLEENARGGAMTYTKKIPLGHKEELERKQRDYHDHNLTLLPNIINTLFAAIEAIETKGIPYALIGGIAAKELGRPRVTHDIDIFVKPDDAENILEILKQNGFETEKRDPFWLYKAWRDEVLVDVIFRSCGDIYFEEEVRNHVRRIPYDGKFINAISPEDFIVIKAAAHQEDNPHHWHDALAVLTQGNIDWNYLFKRSRYCPRRVLALLIYAQSNDIAVPIDLIEKLYKSIFEHPTYVPESIHFPYRKEKHKDESSASIDKIGQPIYTKGRIMEALTTDERIAEHDIKVLVSESGIVIKGEVFSNEQRNAVEEVIRRIAPHLDLNNQVHVRVLTPPEGSEAIS
jgi:predicted nucleotidyltransferase